MTARFTASVSIRPAVLAEHELVPLNRLRQQRVDAAALDFLRDETDADEDGDEQAEDRRRRQAEILDDLDVLPRRELADQIRAPISRTANNTGCRAPCRGPIRETR